MSHESSKRLQPFTIEETQAPLEHGDERVDGPGLAWRTLLSADRTPTAEVSAGVCELQPGGQLKLHRHPTLEVYHFLQGEGLVTLEDRNVPVRAGTTLSIPGDAPHGIRNTGSSVLKLFYVFPIDSYADVQYTMLET